MKKRMVLGLLMMTVLPPLAGWAQGPVHASHSVAQQAASEKTSISDRQLKNFAAARADLNRIRTAYGAKLKAAETAAERKEIVREGSQAVRKALRKRGMTPDQFREMAFTIRDNPKLRQKLEAMEPDNL